MAHPPDGQRPETSIFDLPRPQGFSMGTTGRKLERIPSEHVLSNATRSEVPAPEAQHQNDPESARNEPPSESSPATLPFAPLAIVDRDETIESDFGRVLATPDSLSITPHLPTMAPPALPLATGSGAGQPQDRGGQHPQGFRSTGTVFDQEYLDAWLANGIDPRSTDTFVQQQRQFGAIANERAKSNMASDNPQERRRMAVAAAASASAAQLPQGGQSSGASQYSQAFQAPRGAQYPQASQFAQASPFSQASQVLQAAPLPHASSSPQNHYQMASEYSSDPAMEARHREAMDFTRGTIHENIKNNLHSQDFDGVNINPALLLSEQYLRQEPSSLSAHPQNEANRDAARERKSSFSLNADEALSFRMNDHDDSENAKLTAKRMGKHDAAVAAQVEKKKSHNAMPYPSVGVLAGTRGGFAHGPGYFVNDKKMEPAIPSPMFDPDVVEGTGGLLGTRAGAAAQRGMQMGGVSGPDDRDALFEELTGTKAGSDKYKKAWMDAFMAEKERNPELLANIAGPAQHGQNNGGLLGISDYSQLPSAAPRVNVFEEFGEIGTARWVEQFATQKERVVNPPRRVAPATSSGLPGPSTSSGIDASASPQDKRRLSVGSDGIDWNEFIDWEADDRDVDPDYLFDNNYIPDDAKSDEMEFVGGDEPFGPYGPPVPGKHTAAKPAAGINIAPRFDATATGFGRSAGMDFSSGVGMSGLAFGSDLMDFSSFMDTSGNGFESASMNNYLSVGMSQRDMASSSMSNAHPFDISSGNFGNNVASSSRNVYHQQGLSSFRHPSLDNGIASTSQSSASMSTPHPFDLSTGNFGSNLGSGFASNSRNAQQGIATSRSPNLDNGTPFLSPSSTSMDISPPSQGIPSPAVPAQQGAPQGRQPGRPRTKPAPINTGGVASPAKKRTFSNYANSTIKEDIPTPTLGSFQQSPPAKSTNTNHFAGSPPRAHSPNSMRAANFASRPQQTPTKTGTRSQYRAPAGERHSPSSAKAAGFGGRGTGVVSGIATAGFVQAPITPHPSLPLRPQVVNPNVAAVLAAGEQMSPTGSAAGMDAGMGGSGGRGSTGAGRGASGSPNAARGRGRGGPANVAGAGRGASGSGVARTPKASGSSRGRGAGGSGSKRGRGGRGGAGGGAAGETSTAGA